MFRVLYAFGCSPGGGWSSGVQTSGVDVMTKVIPLEGWVCYTQCSQYVLSLLCKKGTAHHLTGKTKDIQYCDCTMYENTKNLMTVTSNPNQ